MASLFKRKKSNCWWVQFRRNGKIYQRSTRFTYDVSGHTRRARELCEQLTLQESHESKLCPDEKWESWIFDFLKQRYSDNPRTLHRRHCMWRNVNVFFRKHNIATPRQLTYSRVLEFLAWRPNPDTKELFRCSRNTTIQEMKFLGLLMGEAVRRGFAVTNPARGLGLKKTRPKEKCEIALEEEAVIRRELASGRWPEWMSISFEIAMKQGCRLRETCLPLTDVNIRDGTITFNAKCGRFTTALHPDLVPLFQRLKAEGCKMSCDMPPMPSKWFWMMFKKLNLRHITFHSTRVSVVTRLARAGVPERHTMRFVGHASSTIHAIYTKLRVDDLRPCLDALKSMAANPGDPATTPAPNQQSFVLRETDSPPPSSPCQTSTPLQVPEPVPSH